MTTSTKAAQERAEASFKKKKQQLDEGQKAMAEYEANALAVREKTERLRTLRLAREDAQNSLPKPAAATGKRKRPGSPDA